MTSLRQEKKCWVAFVVRPTRDGRPPNSKVVEKFEKKLFILFHGKVKVFSPKNDLNSINVHFKVVH